LVRGRIDAHDRAGLDHDRSGLPATWSGEHDCRHGGSRCKCERAAAGEQQPLPREGALLGEPAAAVQRAARVVHQSGAGGIPVAGALGERALEDRVDLLRKLRPALAERGSRLVDVSVEHAHQ
jgi:hypothetical protein